MTPEIVKDRLAEIEAQQGDPEVAHGLEDTLYADVLEAIAAGKCKNPRECARLALTSAAMDFPRWRA